MLYSTSEMKPDMSRKRGWVLKRGGVMSLGRLLRNISILKGKVCLNTYKTEDSRLLLHRTYMSYA